MKIEKKRRVILRKKNIWKITPIILLLLSFPFQHKPCLHKLPSCTVSSYYNFKVAMNSDFFSPTQFLSSYALIFIKFLTHIQTGLLTAIIWKIIAFPEFLIIYLFGNLTIAITLEMLIAHYLMINHFFRSFWLTFKLFFFWAR